MECFISASGWHNDVLSIFGAYSAIGTFSKYGASPLNWDSDGFWSIVKKWESSCLFLSHSQMAELLFPAVLLLRASPALIFLSLFCCPLHWIFLMKTVAATAQDGTDELSHWPECWLRSETGFWMVHPGLPRPEQWCSLSALTILLQGRMVLLVHRPVASCLHTALCESQWLTDLH